MELSVTIVSMSKAPDGSALIKVRAPAWQASDAAMEKLQNMQPHNLDMIIKRHKDKRSLNANALLWKCIGSLAEVLNVSKDEIYLKSLRDYGVQTVLAVVPEAEPVLRASFREVIPLGRHIINGQVMENFRCIAGSSHYDTAQMSRLLNGVIEDCKEMGGFVPDERTIMTGLELWKKESATCV